MKKITFIFFFAIAFSLAGFSQNCINPVSQQIFQANFNQVAIQQTNQKKLEKATAFAGTNCLMAAQVKNIALLFTEDNYRLEFCKVAYSHTFDQVNFYDVYDSFTAFSYAFRLHDYIHEPVAAPAPVEPAILVAPAPMSPSFPNVAYPSSINYNGKRGCNGPVITEMAFKSIAQNIFVQPTDESKQVAIQNASNSSCLDFAQLMKLVSMLKSEDFRLQQMQSAFPRIYDLENYQSGIVLFTDIRLQNQWKEFASGYLTPPVAVPAPAPVVCSVSTTDFNGIMTSLKAKSFPADKMGLVELLAKDHCFSVDQIKLIGKEFSFGDEKVKAFKLLYAKCADQNNYYKLVDELTFSSDKEKLNTFIKNGGK
ncbi:MAG: DUF4476 domain-containing protein [Bacteroidia bacterium]